MRNSDGEQNESWNKLPIDRGFSEGTEKQLAQFNNYQNKKDELMLKTVVKLNKANEKRKGKHDGIWRIKARLKRFGQVEEAWLKVAVGKRGLTGKAAMC